jgi:hypothetical protein
MARLSTQLRRRFISGRRAFNSVKRDDFDSVEGEAFNIVERRAFNSVKWEREASNPVGIQAFQLSKERVC